MQPLIARVLPLTQTRAVKGVFDYRLTPQLGEVSVGAILRVPFSGRQILAVVAELAHSSEVPPEKLATATAVLPAKLPADLVALAQWMASEYCSTPARALQLLMPAGAARGAKEKEILVASITAAGLEALIASPPGSGGNATPAMPRLTPGQRSVLEQLRSGQALAAATLGTATLRRLEGRGLVQIEKATVARRPAQHSVSSAAVSAPSLTAEQQQALVPLLAALASSAAKTQSFLLHGVTGSGKTEVYLHAAEAALEAGRTVIILVPEIGLTPQALARFQARFGDVVAVLHSAMSEGKRHDEWLRLRRGEARVCVGPRSAIFAPLADIGLIVVDEEHESSYKHEGDPRYDARHVAEKRAGDHGAVLLYGSATPRPETVHSAQRIRLQRRVDGRALPAVEVLDMKGLHHPLHPTTRLALADVKHEHAKAIVLLNRRGWSNFLSCGSCGRVWKCPNCDVSLVMHRSGGIVSCHHCGHREQIPRSCPDCGSVSVARHGAGTERLEQELVDAFSSPDFPVLRLDADASGVDARAQILERFQSAPAGILVGTQMIAKGHDFNDVSLGVVVDADQTMRFPDFRSEERTFSLVTQLAGRTGRGGEGKVLVQTMEPSARPIQLAARHDSERFLYGELKRREALSYPPYATLIRIVCGSADQHAAHATAAALRQLIDPPGSRLLGPAPLFTLRGKHRSQLVLKSTQRPAAIAAVGAAVDAISGAKGHRDVSISVDVDPQ